MGFCVSPGALRELQNLGVTSIPQIQETNIITRATVYLSGKELVTDDFPAVEDMSRYARIIPKKVLENTHLEAARNAGANILEGANIVNFEVKKLGNSYCGASQTSKDHQS
jgi:2-polyprenyl-6-methoxyphenol hydroxylase-like FAD-dependent oxidoreductase